MSAYPSVSTGMAAEHEHFADLNRRRDRAVRLRRMLEHPGWAILIENMQAELDALEEKILAGNLDPVQYAAYTGERRGLLKALRHAEDEAGATGLTQSEEFDD